MYITVPRTFVRHCIVVKYCAKYMWRLSCSQEHFSNFSYALMTMYVMTLGELNYHDDFLPWDVLPFPVLTNILFVVLVLGMPIIMMNMLVCS